MTALELVTSRRDEILEVARRYGASNVRLFGSVGRGDADENSDVDFLVDLAPDRTLFDLGGLVAELCERLKQDVDVVTEQGLRERIRDRILREARPL